MVLLSTQFFPFVFDTWFFFFVCVKFEERQRNAEKSREKLHRKIFCLFVEKMKRTWNSLTAWSTLPLSPVPWDASLFTSQFRLTAVGSRASSHLALQLWNSLPPDLRNTDFFRAFQNKPLTHPFRLTHSAICFFIKVFFTVNLFVLYVRCPCLSIHYTASMSKPKGSGKAMMFTIADSSSAVVQNQQIRHRCASPGFWRS